MSPRKISSSRKGLCVTRGLYPFLLVAGIGAVCLTLFIPETSVKAATKAETRGYLITKFGYAEYYGDFAKDCPEGFQRTTYENFLFSLDAAERERLLKPENATELGRHWKGEFTRGPNGEDLCNNPRSFVGDPRHPVNRLEQSKKAFGLNLDGTSDGRGTSKSCTHQKFVGPNGEPGIDNQAFRAIGCGKLWHGPNAQEEGDEAGFMLQWMKDGIRNYVMEIRGIGDMRNDDVEVSIYSTESKPIVDAANNFLNNQTMEITRNPRWHNTFHGRIIDGVLTTDTADVVRLRGPIQLGVKGLAHEQEFHRAKFQLKLNDNGTVKGVMGAYMTPEDFNEISAYGGIGHCAISNVDAGSEFNAVKALADGMPDPKTGECTMTSMAYHVEAVPAYLLHPDALSAEEPPMGAAGLHLGGE